ISDASYSHACAVMAGGSVVCWGANYVGQLGHAAGTKGDIEDCSPGLACNPNPEPVEGLSGVSRVYAGDGSTCALAANEVHCWGWNGLGIHGPDSGVRGRSPVPTRVQGLPPTIAGMWHGKSTAHAFTPSGELW